MKVPSVECPLFHLKLYHISTKLFHFVVVDVEDRSHASFVLFLFIYEGCLLTFHTLTTGTSPSQGATAAVCSVRLHSSVLLRTNVKCFFVFVQDATTVGEPLLLSTSPFHQPTSVTTGTSPSQGATAAVCSVRLHSSVLLRTSVKCFFVFVQDATTVGVPLLLSTSPCHQLTSVTTGTSPSQGATAAVFSVRLHSSVLLRTSVKCFFVFVQDATTVGEPLLLSTSPPCHQPTSVTTDTSPSQGATAVCSTVHNLPSYSSKKWM